MFAVDGGRGRRPLVVSARRRRRRRRQTRQRWGHRNSVQQKLLHFLCALSDYDRGGGGWLRARNAVEMAAVDLCGPTQISFTEYPPAGRS
jgi:hypothetical protein